MPIKSLSHRRLALLLAGLLACACARAGHDDDSGEAHGKHDHERARHALTRGEVRPIAEILALVADQVPGEVVEVEFERSGRRDAAAWFYELKILSDDGRVLEVVVDAATGRVLEVEED